VPNRRHPPLVEFPFRAQVEKFYFSFFLPYNLNLLNSNAFISPEESIAGSIAPGKLQDKHKTISQDTERIQV
jgi:hypothetical protein